MHSRSFVRLLDRMLDDTGQQVGEPAFESTSFMFAVTLRLDMIALSRNLSPPNVEL
jgi:hypothetical protein